jgi:peptidoglycan/LPS O-acetylase OafA/YrhL
MRFGQAQWKGMPSAEIPQNWNRDWTRLDGVDLLRGLAIFFVLMNHVNMRLLFAHVPYTRGLPLQLASSLVWNGQEGVQIFFAISGFLITSTSLRRWGALDKVSIRGFYRIRFARIAPLLLALLAILSCLHFAGQRWAAFDDFVVSAKTGGLGRALVAALTFHINYLEAFRGYLPGNWDILWSLSVEEMFYLFFPLIFPPIWRVFGKGKLLIALLLIFVVIGPFARADAFRHNPVWYEYSYLGGMDAIALGCLAALLLSRVQLSRRLRWIVGCAGGAIMLFCLCDSIQAGRWGLEKNGLSMTILAVGTCMVIAVASQTGWRSPRIFAPVLLLGRRSYEIYLCHMFVVFALFALFVHAGKPMWAAPVLFLAVIVVAGALGELIARFYSEPMNRRLRKPSTTQTILPVRV